MREVLNIQQHMRPIIEEVYVHFLTDSADEEEREYAAPNQEIEVNLIHRNYISKRDLDICLAHDIQAHEGHPNFEDMLTLHQCLQEIYQEPEGAAAE